LFQRRNERPEIKGIDKRHVHCAQREIWPGRKGKDKGEKIKQRGMWPGRKGR
jgi:hypothetical protein